VERVVRRAPRARGGKAGLSEERLEQERLELAPRVLVRVLGVDALARGEASAALAQAHLDRAPRLQVHLHAAARRIVEAHVVEPVDREIEPEAAIEVQQRVAVEGRGHAQRVVVGRVEPRRILLRIDADEQRAARPPPAVLVDGAQEAHRLIGREVADARARIEEERRLVRDLRTQDELAGEIRDQADHLHRGEIRRHARERAADLRLGDVHRHVARALQEGKPCLRLAAVAGADVDQLPDRAHRPRDFGAMLLEDLALGARGVVLGQLADGAVERAAQLVVEELGRDPRRRLQQAAHHLLALVGLVAFGDPAHDADARLSGAQGAPPR
jgi:hypothetical protein